MAVAIDPRAHLLARLRLLTDHQPRSDGRYVCYWMQQHRRLHHNFALQHAVFRAREAGVPLLIYEGLRCDYPYASDRHHAVAVRGMVEHQAALADSGVAYLPYAEPRPGAGRGLVARLLAPAVEVVTDDVPHFVVPGHLRALARLANEAGIRATAVDSNGLLPIRLLDKPCPTAAVFRRHLHRHARAALAAMPAADPLAEVALPRFDEGWLGPIREQFGDHRPWLQRFVRDQRAALADLDIDHGIAPVAGTGGRTPGLANLARFLADGLERYADARSDPESGAASGLSPALHWGHLASHEVVAAVLAREPDFDPGRLPEKGGRRQGFWGLDDSSEAFLDELLTWRELGFSTAALIGDAAMAWDSLPAWARASLDAHRDDERPRTYTRAEFEAAATDDPLWNAAQRQLLREGRIHNYLRMLWGKKVLEWSSDPEQALATLFHLNDRYALDGRDPNSVSGITWCFGRYDRPWPERAIYGVVRSMSSASAERKFKLGPYLDRYGR